MLDPWRYLRAAFVAIAEGISHSAPVNGFTPWAWAEHESQKANAAIGDDASTPASMRSPRATRHPADRRGVNPGASGKYFWRARHQGAEALRATRSVASIEPWRAPRSDHPSRDRRIRDADIAPIDGVGEVPLLAFDAEEKDLAVLIRPGAVR